MRLILRILGTWLLAMAVILLVIDGTKSLAANGLVTTSLGETWMSLSETSLDAVKAFIDTRFFGPLLEPLLAALLASPGFAVFGAPGLLLTFLGRPVETRRFVKQDQF